MYEVSLLYPKRYLTYSPETNCWRPPNCQPHIRLRAEFCNFWSQFICKRKLLAELGINIKFKNQGQKYSMPLIWALFIPYDPIHFGSFRISKTYLLRSESTLTQMGSWCPLCGLLFYVRVWVLIWSYVFFSILIMHFKLHFTPIFNLIEIDYKLARNSSAVCIFKNAYIFKLHQDNGFFPKKMVITYSGSKQLKSFYTNTSYAANNVIDIYIFKIWILSVFVSQREALNIMYSCHNFNWKAI